MDTENIELTLLLEAIYMKYGYDFRQYAKASINRRVQRRLELEKLRYISELQLAVLYRKPIFEKLLLDFSINVTEMFRDPEFYLTLRKKVVPVLRTYPFIRVWVAGCSTGEEVYSLAILFKEENILDRVQIYATDFNKSALDSAKQGIYPIRKIREYTTNYQKAGGMTSFSDYYTARYDSAALSDELKQHIVFSTHNLASDTVFNEMQLICCRNVLIYFETTLQNHVVELFHQSLCDGGFLCLGKKEAIRYSDTKKQFEEVDPKIKYFGNGINSRGGMTYKGIVIGASFGGWRAIKEILKRLPEDFSAPLLIVQHLAPLSHNSMPDSLNRQIPLKTKEADEKEVIQAGTVYLAPPNYHLLLEKDLTISLSVGEKVHHSRPSIDVLFESAADALDNQLIGVILTGANSDGAKGIQTIKKAGGVTIAQDPKTAESPIMPRSAIETGCVDHIVKLDEIGPLLLSIVN